MANESKTELREKKVDELRDMAREQDVDRASRMKKEELVDALAESGGAGDDAGRDESAPTDIHTGDQTSDSIKYSQVIHSPDESPERDGRSLVTTNHQVIREWAESRGGSPATVDGTEQSDGLGVLRITFGDDLPENLRRVEWDEWFDTFDKRKLNLIYQDKKKDGSTSTFHRLESPDREDG
jgi:hypothetical protein